MIVTPEINYQRLFESAPGLYLILDQNLHIITASKAYLDATMTDLAVIRGRYLFDVFPDNPEDPDATGESNLHASLKNVLSSGTPHSMAVQKYDIRRPDGSFEERYWSPLNRPVFNGEGVLEYIIHRVEDVSAFMHIKKQQAQQQQVAAGMQQRLQEMESEIFNRAQEIQLINDRLYAEAVQRERAEAALQQQTLQLAKANKELETFSYSVSHDLRAPLRIIDGYTEIAMTDYSSKLDDEGRRILGIIASNVQRMGQLIDDLLNLSRMSRQELEVYPVSMDALVAAVIAEQLNGNVHQYSISVSQLPPASCDRSLITQVWTNLISNAIKYAKPKEHPVIEIDSYTAPGEIIYRVKDNGVGFNMKYADKLFGVFQRLHKMTEFEGTGVGLALVHQIVSRHGGRVWAEAETGKGATFSFSLPV